MKINDRRNVIEAYLFLTPAILLIGLFGIFPAFFTLFVSMHKWRIKRGRFLGFDNFIEAFGSPAIILGLIAAVALIIAAAWFRNRRETLVPALPARAKNVLGWLAILAGILALVFLLPAVFEFGDDDMMESLKATVFYSLGTVPSQLIGGLILAVLLDRKFRGKQAFRVIFLLPYIVPSVATAAVFERIFSLRQESLINQAIALFGAEPLQWLQEPSGIFSMLFGISEGATGFLAQYWNTWAQGPSLGLTTIMIYNWWVFTGYYALIYANGLSQIPRQLYEAAEIDGAGAWTVFRRIIVPLLSPSTYFLTMLGIIGTFKAFNHIYVLRNPAAGGSVDTFSIHIFFTFFRRSRFGYASALSLLLFAIVIGLTLLQRRIMEKRVNFGD